MLDLSSSDFDTNPSLRRNQIAQSLGRVTAYAENGDLRAAMDRVLSDVMIRMDGFYGGDPVDDYIVTQAGQDLIRPEVASHYSKLRDAYLQRPSNLPFPRRREGARAVPSSRSRSRCEGRP